MNQAMMKPAPCDQAGLNQISGVPIPGADHPAPCFASALFTCEQQVREIRNALETLLRAGEADDVIDRLDAAIDVLAELGHPMAGMCRAANLENVQIVGWSNLGPRIAQLDAEGPRITAIGINISCQGHGFIDESGEANPYLETAFYSDNAFGFSAASRTALLTGYADFGNEWQDGFVDIDETLSCSGLSELQAAVYRLESEFRRAPCENGADHDALFIGSAFLATRIHQAVREAVLNQGLPRALTVLVDSNESSPFFDAPVITAGEYRQFAPQIAPESQPADSAPVGFELPDEAPATPAKSPEPATQSGNSLRRSVMARSTETTPTPPPAAPEATPSLLGRLFRRK